MIGAGGAKQGGKFVIDQTANVLNRDVS